MTEGRRPIFMVNPEGTALCRMTYGANATSNTATCSKLRTEDK
jgi:hypothetical protein